VTPDNSAWISGATGWLPVSTASGSIAMTDMRAEGTTGRPMPDNFVEGVQLFLL
jgi:hypothetical protein